MAPDNVTFDAQNPLNALPRSSSCTNGSHYNSAQGAASLAWLAAASFGFCICAPAAGLGACTNVWCVLFGETHIQRGSCDKVSPMETSVVR